MTDSRMIVPRAIVGYGTTRGGSRMPSLDHGVSEDDMMRLCTTQVGASAPRSCTGGPRVSRVSWSDAHE